MFYNIRTMMLDRFMEALIEDKHDLIVQEGVYSEKEIEEKWNEFMVEYHSVIKDANYRSFLHKTGRIAMTETKIVCVVNIVSYLQELAQLEVYSPILLNELTKLGFHIEFKDEVQYYNDLEKILVKLKKEQRDLRLMNKEIESEQENSKISYDQFGDSISAIMDKYKIVINPNTTSVWSYLYTLKRLLNDKK